VQTRSVDDSIRRDLGHELRRIVDRAVRAGVLDRFLMLTRDRGGVAC